MIPASTLAIFVVPAIGVCFVGALFVFTGMYDRRALRRADVLERKVGS